MGVRTFTCTACGATVRIAVQPETIGMARTGRDYADCSECRAHFDDQQTDEISGNENHRKVATVDLLRAARMLGQPGVANVGWVREHLMGEILQHEGVLVVPVWAVRSYAEEHGITIDPLADRLVMWVQRRPTG